MQTARTTIELDKEILKEAKQRAIEEEKSLKKIINEALRDQFRLNAKRKKTKFKFKSYDMGDIKTPLTHEYIYEDI